MPFSTVAWSLKGSFLPSRRPISLGGTQRAVAIFGVILAPVVSGCMEAKRSFGDTVKDTSDAGYSNASFGADASTSKVTDSATAESSNATETREVAFESSETSRDGGHSESSPDGGSECVPAVCAESTECRTYRAVNCESSDDVECEITNTDAETPCDSGNGRCDGMGECVVPNRAVLGAACERDEECGSQHCVVGVGGDKLCCDTACDGACTTCSETGHCDATPVEDATCEELTCDASSTCVEYPADKAVATCTAFGQCETAASYCEPNFAIDVECGDGMVCDGRGACVRDCPDPGVERICTTECPCETGEGVCTNNNQCADGFVCTSDAVAKLGFPAASCLPAHCVNNEQDAEETSVDCGGGCGCRATYEVVAVTGIPQGASLGGINAMSGDGSAFAANLTRPGDRFPLPFPARIDAKGVLTELDGFGVYGTAFAINGNGSVVVGDLWCEDPPDCTSSAGRPFRWTNDTTPTAVFRRGTGRAVSASGTIVAGTQADPASGATFAFRASSQHIDIPQLDTVIGMSADGEFIAGRSSTADVGALWSMTLQGLVTLTPPSEWLTWGINVLSNDGKTFAGSARTDNTNVMPAYIWRGDTFYEFPKLPGADYNQFGAISADGKVAVGLSGTNSVQRAFIWDESTGIRTVLSETVARGLELPVDLELRTVDFLSHDGTVLVGRIPLTSPPQYWRITLLP